MPEPSRRVWTRRRLLAATALLVTAYAVLLAVFGRSRMTVAAYDRVRLGMTAAEVEAALGVTPGECIPTADRVFVVREREETWAFDPSEHHMRPSGPASCEVVSKSTGNVVAESRGWADGDHMITVT